jgi:acetoin utilization deacetylase AcuC-like enzyme
MLLYDPSIETNMLDYGIMIPMAADRREKIMAHLVKCGSALPVYDFAGVRAAAGITEAFSRDDLERVHAKEYIQVLFNESPDPKALEKELLATYELINPDGSYNRYEPERATKALHEMLESTLSRIEGTWLSCRAALAGVESPVKNFCYYFGGGNHHARYERSSGFCILNDIVIAARKLIAEGNADLVWIIDVDAHKGDGSAELIRRAKDHGELYNGRNAQIIGLSIHMAKGWPLDSESLARAQSGHAPLVDSDIDIPIDCGEEALYIPRLVEGIAKLETLSGGRRPDIVIVVDGVDVYEHDGLASTKLINLTLEQCVERDNLILSYVQERGLPSAWVNAGGYGERAWEPTAHFLARLSAVLPLPPESAILNNTGVLHDSGD